MNKKVFSNFLYQASYQLLLILMPIITIPIVSRALGPSGIGVYQYVYSIVSYFVLVAGLGLQNYGVREIAIVRSDRQKLSKKFWELTLFNIFFSIIIFVIYILLVPFFRYSSLFFIQGATVLSNLFDISWFFAGLEDFRKVTIRNFIVRISTFILILLFIRNKNDLILYFIIMSISTLLGQMSLWISLKKFVDLSKVTMKEIWSHFKPSLSFFIARIAFQFYYNVSLTLLGIFSTMKDVGFFSNGVMLVSVAGSVINSLNTVMIPRMSNMYGNDDEEGMIKILSKTVHLQLYFTIAIVFGIITINKQMIMWFYGPEFVQLEHMVPLIAPILVFQTLQTSIASQYLIPKKEMFAYNQTVLIGALCCTIINILLIPKIGVYGAITGYGIGYIILCILRSRVLLKSTVFRFNWRLIIGSIISGLIMLIVTTLLTNNLSSSITTTAIQCLVGMILYLGFSTIIKINPLLDFVFLNKIVRKVKSVINKINK